MADRPPLSLTPFFLDFCTGGDEKSPTATLDEILQEKDFTRDDISYQAFQYYAQVSREGHVETMLASKTHAGCSFLSGLLRCQPF